jgi:hypothetical protein
MNCKANKNIFIKDKNGKLSPDVIDHSSFHDCKRNLHCQAPLGEITFNPNISKVKLK